MCSMRCLVVVAILLLALPPFSVPLLREANAERAGTLLAPRAGAHEPAGRERLAGSETNGDSARTVTAQLGVGAPQEPAQQPTCGAADLSKLNSRIYVAPGGSDGADCGATVATADWHAADLHDPEPQCGETRGRLLAEALCAQL